MRRFCTSGALIVVGRTEITQNGSPAIISNITYRNYTAPIVSAIFVYGCRLNGISCLASASFAALQNRHLLARRQAVAPSPYSRAVIQLCGLKLKVLSADNMSGMGI